MAANRKKQFIPPYYAILKTNICFDKIICQKSENYLKTIISHSFYYYWTEIMLQCRKIPHWDTSIHAFHPLAWLSQRIPQKSHCYTQVGNKYSSCFYEMREVLDIMSLKYPPHFMGVFLYMGIYSDNYKEAILYGGTAAASNHHTLPILFHNSFQFTIQNSPAVDFVVLSSNINHENGYIVDLLKQICIALCLQKNKGTMIFKIKSIFHSLTIDVLYLLCGMYDKVFMTKPTCTNPCELSRYVVCKGFRRPKKKESLMSTFQTLYLKLTNCLPHEYIERIFSEPIPLFFLNKIEELNSIFGQPCLEHVHNVLINHRDTKYDKIKSDLMKCQEWCSRHRVSPYLQS